MNVDNILARVTRPARYTGGEWNAVVKDWEQAEVRMALAYPDLYEIGMSNLGLSILYDLVNRQPYALAERVYAPWTDMEGEMRRAGIPLFSLESRRLLRDFDILGFSLGYELTYTNVLNMLSLAGIPLLSQEREGSFPLVIGGGSGALNPEMMADFFDLFLLGDGEEVLLEFLELFRLWKGEGGTKEDLLRRAAGLEGAYVPSFYKVDYHADGTVARVSPAVPEAKKVVCRRFVTSLPPPVVKPVVPFMEVVHDRGAIEIQRGCTRGCRFCQAGVIYRPVRERTPPEIVEAVRQLLKNTGYDEVSLISLSTSDYPHIEEVVSALARRYAGEALFISLPSLRPDSFTEQLAQALKPFKKTGLTFAPEAGSLRLRQAINKPLADEDLIRVARLASQGGWRNLKLYFLVGLPGETEEDIRSIIDLVRKVKAEGKMQVKVNVGNFIPKPHTPFQWLPQASAEEFEARHQVLKRGLKRLGVTLSWGEPRVSLLEAVLSRGDRRLGKAILKAWKLGARFDSWSDNFSWERWEQALAEEGLDPSFYAHRQRPLAEVFPWSHIDSGVSAAFLRKEYQRAQRGKETLDCRCGPCAMCGLQRWDPRCQSSSRLLMAETRKGPGKGG